jgi:hypothetical protein
LIFWPTPGSTGSIFWWLIGGDWRKVLFIDQSRHSSNMAAMAAIFDLVSINYLTERLRRLVQFFCGSFGVLFSSHHIPLLPKPYLPYTHRQLPTRGGGICHALRSPCSIQTAMPLGQQISSLESLMYNFINLVTRSAPCLVPR